VPVEPTPEMLSAVGMMDGYDWHAPGCSPDADHANWYSAMIAAAPAAPQAEPKRDWSTIDAAIREYVNNYELIGEDDAGADACYTPTERERDLIYDAINGLLADESFVAAISAPQAEPKRELTADERDVLDSALRSSVRVVARGVAEPKPTPASGDDLGVYKGMADSYRNDAEPTGAPYGIIDPDYGRVYTIARKLAWEEGYAIGLHGSFTRDLDMIAVPWAERACEPEHLIRRIVDATGLKLRDGVGVKPHGRRAWTLLFPAFGDPRFVDLSVVPRIGGSDGN
jgi:hypothetical protein